MTLAKTKSFTDDKGNRMIFPAMIIRDDRDRPTATDVMFWAMEMNVILNDLKSDEGWYEFDTENFPHVSMNVCSRAFQHGAATGYVFAGPEFDKVVNEQRTDSDGSSGSGDGEPGTDDQERTGSQD